MKTKLSLILPIVLLMLLPAFTIRAHAANQIVSNLGDTGLASQLRQKIKACQSGTSPGGTITFSVAGTITLDANKGPLPVITSNVTINGGGTVEISGNDAIRIFNVANGGTLTLNNITISHANSDNGDGGAIASTGALNVNNSKFFNNTTSSGWSGGAILCWGPLNITACEFAFNNGGGGAVKPRGGAATTTISGTNFHDNQSSSSAGGGYGGAMQVFDGPSVRITNCRFSNNKAGAQGGAIYVSSNCEVAIYSSTFSGNSTFSVGGAIASSQSSSVSLTDVTLSGNSASDSGGGGMFNLGTATIRNVTFSGNTGPTGGGLWNGNYAGLTNVTFSGNSASDNPGGGAIHNSKTAVLTNVTVSGNSSPGVAGIWNIGTTTLINTVIAKGASGANCAGLSNAGTFNLSDDSTCGFTTKADLLPRDNVTDLLLGPLANNGGPTFTHMPQPGSRAIDNGTATNAPPTDQRGVTRPQGAAVDVGAVEVVPQVFEDTDPAITYDNWTAFGASSASGGFFRWNNSANLTASYKFSGTSIKWITWKGRQQGKALVTIDGVNKGTFDLYNATALWNQQFLFSGLASAAHTVLIKVTGTKNPSSTNFYVPVDGFVVGTSTSVVQESAPAVQYGTWMGKKQSLASGRSYRISSSTLGDATIAFNGPAITFMTARGPTYGKVNVYIDEFPVSSNLDLYAPTQQWQQRIVYSRLANGPHTIDIVPTHTKNASSSGYGVVLDAFEGYFIPPE